jgi:hypothetical protein
VKSNNSTWLLVGGSEPFSLPAMTHGELIRRTAVSSGEELQLWRLRDAGPQ